MRSPSTQAIALLVVHLNAVLISTDADLLQPFKDLFTHPQRFYASYLPALPHDDDFEVLRQIRTEGSSVYTCKNGHYYTIGNCQKPVEVSTCPTCKTAIGGISYKLSEGNRVLQGEIERSEHGYCVQEASERAQEPQSVRNMGLLNTTVIRLLLDCTLYLSSLRSEAAVRGLLAAGSQISVI